MNFPASEHFTLCNEMKCYLQNLWKCTTPKIIREGVHSVENDEAAWSAMIDNIVVQELWQLKECFKWAENVLNRDTFYLIL